MHKKLTGISAITKSVRVSLLVVLAFLAGNLLSLHPGASAQDQPGDVVFATPEDAITFYLEGVMQGDVSHIMQACAVTELSENVRFDLWIDFVGYLTSVSPAPSDYPLYVELNEGYYSWQLLQQVRNIAYRLLANETDVTTGRTTAMDLEGATQFVAALNPERLAGLEIVTMGLPDPELAANERTVNLWTRNAQIYGADEYTERVVLLLFEGNYYYIGFTVMRYGDTWKISDAASPLGNALLSGTLEEITREDFQALIGDD
jgi:hypothetical protein